jgi:hypothetical protein
VFLLLAVWGFATCKFIRLESILVVTRRAQAAAYLVAVDFLSVLFTAYFACRARNPLELSSLHGHRQQGHHFSANERCAVLAFDASDPKFICANLFIFLTLVQIF